MSQRVFLSEDDIPKQWYNLAADLPTPPQPYLGPDGNPVTPDMMTPIFPMNLIEQEMSPQRWIDIPEDIRRILAKWRPSPLHRALSSGKSPGNTCQNLLQKRKCFSPGKPQTQYRGSTGLLQQNCGNKKNNHRNRCGTMGKCSRLRLCPVGSGM